MATQNEITQITKPDFFDLISCMRKIEETSKQILGKILTRASSYNSSNLSKVQDFLSDSYINLVADFIIYIRDYFPSIYYRIYITINWDEKFDTEMDRLFAHIEQKYLKHFHKMNRNIYDEIKETFEKEKIEHNYYGTLEFSFDKLLFLVYLSENIDKKSFMHDFFVLNKENIVTTIRENPESFKAIYSKINQIFKNHENGSNSNQYWETFNGLMDIIKNSYENWYDWWAVNLLYYQVGNYIKLNQKHKNKQLITKRITELVLEKLHLEIKKWNFLIYDKKQADKIKDSFLVNSIKYKDFYDEFLTIKNNILSYAFYKNFYKWVCAFDKNVNNLNYADWTEEKGKLDSALIQKDVLVLQWAIMTISKSDVMGVVMPILISKFCKSFQINHEDFKILRYVSTLSLEWWYENYTYMNIFFDNIEKILFAESEFKRMQKYFYLFASWLIIAWLCLSYVWTQQKSGLLIFLIVVYLAFYFDEKFSLRQHFRVIWLRSLVGWFIIVLLVFSNTSFIESIKNLIHT